MTTGNDHRAGKPPAGVAYRESLRTPLYWYPIALFVAGLLAAEFHVSDIALSDWLAFGILLPASLVLVWAFGRGRLEIIDGDLRVRGAHIPLREISGAVALDETSLKRLVGREGDPAAFISIRPWIGPGVQLWLDDPEDPTPYWIVSTRHPHEVVDLVRSVHP